MSISSWLRGARSGHVAILVGGDDDAFFDMAQGLDPASVVVIAAPPLLTELGGAAIERGAPLSGLLQSCGLEPDLASAAALGRAAAVLIAPGVVSTDLSFHAARLAARAEVIAGYPVPIEAVRPAAAAQTARVISEGAAAARGPIVAHDAEGRLRQVLPQAEAFEYEGPRPQRGAPSEPPDDPHLDIILAHARFLALTDDAITRQVHRPILKPKTDAVFAYWRAQLQRLRPTVDAGLADQAIARLGALQQHVEDETR